ncbi:MAG: hypothetical protein E7235_02735 [Lachnospiraceae bacterium]|nr:hypothetical protein [Lachnospiraceae bacterium]
MDNEKRTRRSSSGPSRRTSSRPSSHAADEAPKKKRKRRRRKKKNPVFTIIKILIILVIVCGFAGAGALLGVYMGIIDQSPSINIADVVPDNYTSIIYDSEGKEIDMLHSVENREYAKLSDIPQDLKDAVVAIEDERFYSHNGIDLKGIMRAVVANVQSGIKGGSWKAQGASTITQQLIKNEKLSSEKALTRKITEQYMAVTLEKDLEASLGSKDKAKNYILELYLNTIGLNHGLNGVKAAAKFYYGKEVSELTLSECASIAGITKNPSRYSPISNPTANKERQTTVLIKMLELGYITQSEYDEALADDIYSRLVGNSSSDENTTATHSYFVDAVVVELLSQLQEEKGMTKQQAYNAIYSGGLQIYTTIDMGMQSSLDKAIANNSLYPAGSDALAVTYTISVMDKATEKQSHYERKATVNTQEEADAFVQSVKDELLNDSNKLVLDNVSVQKALQTSMVIVDNETGQVKALSGGRDKNGDLVFNRATQGFRQPGSVFKVLAAYVPALDMGVAYPGSVYIDEEFTVNEEWTPSNWWTDGYRGPYTVREAIRDSANIIAAKTITDVGSQNAFNYLLEFGFKELVVSEEKNGKIYSDINANISLGGLTKGVSTLELAGAFAAIANGGLYNEPVFYTKVLDHDGDILLENIPEQKRIIKETTAYLATDMMEDVISGGGTGGLARFTSINMPVAGKTGTTTDDVDLVFAGFTPYYTGAIWMGYDQPKRIVYDKSYHLLIWKAAMEEIHKGLETKQFARPDGLVSHTFCSESGMVPVDGLCTQDYYGASIRSDYSDKDFEFNEEACTTHQKFKVNMTTGRLACPNCPVYDAIDVVLAVQTDEETGYIKIINKPNAEKLEELGLIDIDVNLVCDGFHFGTGISIPMVVDPITGELIPADPSINDGPSLPSMQGGEDREGNDSELSSGLVNIFE